MIITLSRQLGSGGDVIAARVAAALGLMLVDREYVHKAALAAGVPPKVLQKLMYEGKRSFAAELLDSLVSYPEDPSGTMYSPANQMTGLLGPMLIPDSISQEEAAQTIGLVIKDVASRGNIVLLGQGGQVWLRDYQGACHIRVVAPLDKRVSEIAAREHLSAGAARRRVRASDQSRAENLARFHDVNWGDPLLYHLIINTGQTPLESAVSLVVHAAQIVGFQR